MIKISTSCDVCSRTRKDDEVVDASPAIVGFRDCIQWPDVGATPPLVGERHLLLVSYPFLASDQVPFWVLFQPRTADPSPDALALVRCQLRADLGAWDGDWPEGDAYRPERKLEVEVLEVRPLITLPATLPPDPDSPFDAYWDSLFAPGGCRNASAWELGPFTYFEADVEGDVGAIAVCVATPAGRSVILYSTWSMCEDGPFVALNHPLDDATYQALCARVTATPTTEPA